MKKINGLKERGDLCMEIYNVYKCNIKEYGNTDDAFEAGIEAALLTLYPNVRNMVKPLTPKEKLDALYDKIRIKVDKSNPLEDIHKTTKQLCNLYVTEILTSALIDLNDEQVEFWLQVDKEIGKL